MDLPDGDVRFFDDCFSAEENQNLFPRLRDEIRWTQEKIRIYGRDVDLPRLTAWYGDAGASYSYSGITHAPHPWTELLLLIKKRVEARAGESFNSVLLNFYRSGSDGVAWHSDDEPELGPDPVIASASFGAVRTFQLKHKFRKDLKRVALELTGGSLLIMRGPTQKNWLHQVPKTAKNVPPRINLTFRTIRPLIRRA